MSRPTSRSHHTGPGEDTGSATRPHPATGPARPDYATAPASAVHAAPADVFAGRPRTLMLALSAWLTSFLAGLLAVAYSMGRIEQLRDVLRADVRGQRPRITPDSLERVVRATLNVGLAGVTGLIAVQLVLLLLMLAGLHWARVVLTVAGALGVLGTAFATVTFASQTRPLLVAEVLLIIGGTVYMYLPGSGAWFRAQPH